jgi:RND family efflux transporter MFP subunit
MPAGLQIKGRVATAVALLGLISSACDRGAPPPPPPPGVTVAPVVERDINDWEEFTGRLQAVEAVEVRPRVAGYIEKVAFTEGTEVRKGDVLFEIDPRPYQAALAGAEADLARARTRAGLAKSELDRAQRLIAVRAISREDFETRTSTNAESEAEIRAAEAAVATARLNLEWTKVRSPIAGRVSRAEVTEGNLVQAGPPEATLLTRVVSLDPIYAYFDGDEQTYLAFRELARSGDGGGSHHARIPVFLGLANEQGFPHQGYVDFVDNQLDPHTGTIRTRAVFANKDRLFTPGLFARIKLVGNEHHLTPLIQDRAIGTDQDKKFVLVLKPDSTVDYRSVQLGRIVDGLRIVESGLKPGERIVINGLQRARPGTKVAPTLADMTRDSTVTTASTGASVSARP